MIKKFTQKEFDKAPSRAKVLTCECIHCHKEFSVSRHDVQSAENPKRPRNTLEYCSNSCVSLARKTEPQPCGNCGELVQRQQNAKDSSKSGHVFCDSSCAATYNNTHKKHGTRRSKLEKHLENMLKKYYPNLNFICNGKTTIGSELDFYFPDYNFAIEVNGIFHYKPIYGEEKFQQIKNNDAKKKFLCEQNNIDLISINASKCSHLSNKNKIKYWNIFEDILKSKVG